MFRPIAFRIPTFVAAIVLIHNSLASGEEAPRAQPLVLAHYMPWFEAKPASAQWGWHWTMNRFDPDKVIDGQREIAAHYHPLIGPYDSSDPVVLEYHLLLMKVAGIDGVIVDWYGRENVHDYARLHRNTELLLNVVERLDMKFLICYEDQSIPQLIKAGQLAEKDRVAHALKDIEWLRMNWFSKKGYVTLQDMPVLLSFGHEGLTDQEWLDVSKSLKSKLAYFSLHRRREAAIGAFDWPVPSKGLAMAEQFQKDAKQWPHAIPVVYPRFVDIYEQAGLHKSYGRIDDDQGKTFQQLLDRATMQPPVILQIATWNDWGEGTMIEPSVEFGYRDLEIVQSFRRRQLKPQFAVDPKDLRLPHRLLKVRQAQRASTTISVRIAELLSNNRIQEASELLQGIEK